MDRRPAARPSRRPSVRRSLLLAAGASLLLLLLLAPSPADAQDPTPEEASPSPPSIPDPASSSSASSFLDGRYAPSPDVPDVDVLSELDLDLRSIDARLSSGTSGGMTEAYDVYTKGRYPEDLPANDVVTLQTLSTRVDDVVTVGSQTYNAFKDYYGVLNYADQWVLMGFAGEGTAFKNGDVDFAELGLVGRGAAIRYGTLALNVWMSVLGRLEEAANLCVSKADANDLLADEWDRAAALYTGSLAQTAGEFGYMLYTLAQTECLEFGTCEAGDMAPVNDRILDALKDGKAHLRQGNCHDVVVKVNDVRSLMTVPLIQGALRGMYAMDKYGQTQDEDAQGKGAAFAAALLPLVDGCNPPDAEVLLDNLAPGRAPTGDYDEVRAALERSYECLGVTCADVGGILNARQDGYAEGAEACRNVRPVDAGVEYDDALTSGTTVGSGDEEDDLFEYEDYAYFDVKDNPFKGAFPNYDPNERVGTGDSHTGAQMEPARAALISGLSFGIFGVIGGAAITLACHARKEKKEKRELSKVEFVASRNGNRTGEGGLTEDELL